MTNKHEPPEQSRRAAAVIAPAVATESAPPWLVSMIVHMLIVLLLALFYLDPPAAPEPGILLNTQQAGPEEEVELFELGGMNSSTEEEVTSETEVVQTPLAELEPTEVDLADLLTSLPNESDSLAALAAATGSGDGTAGSGQGETSFFGMGGSGRRFVYVFDRSASMNAKITRYSEGFASQVSPLEAAKRELVKSLNSLAEDLSFQIIFYNHFPITFGGEGTKAQLYAATEENKANARAFVEAVPGDGTTDHISALRAALQFDPDVIFVLTDGEYKDDPRPRDVRSIAALCNRKNTVINVIHLTAKPRPGTPLIDLANRTGGKHIFIELELLSNVPAETDGPSS